jgi:hypothetical protein
MLTALKVVKCYASFSTKAGSTKTSESLLMALEHQPEPNGFQRKEKKKSNRGKSTFITGHENVGPYKGIHHEFM